MPDGSEARVNVRLAPFPLNDREILLCRLAWHASGTFDKSDNSGGDPRQQCIIPQMAPISVRWHAGSNGATMRFAPESTDGANAGLNIMRDILEPVRARRRCCIASQKRARAHS